MNKRAQEDTAAHEAKIKKYKKWKTQHSSSLCSCYNEESKYISKCKILAYKTTTIHDNLSLEPLLVFPLQYSGCWHMLHGACHDAPAVYQLIWQAQVHCSHTGDLAACALLSLQQAELHILELPCNYKQHIAINKVLTLHREQMVLQTNYSRKF